MSTACVWHVLVQREIILMFGPGENLRESHCIKQGPLQFNHMHDTSL